MTTNTVHKNYYFNEYFTQTMTTKFYTVKDIPESWTNTKYEVPIFSYKNPNLLIVTLRLCHCINDIMLGRASLA